MTDEIVSTRANPLWVQQPHLLGDIVGGVIAGGRVDIAAECVKVPKKLANNWLETGKAHFYKAHENGTDYTPLAQFYLEVLQAKSLFLSGRIQKIIELADSDDPALRAIYAKFHLWLVTHMDEEKRFSPSLNIKNDTTHNHTGTIRVTYANGDAWRLGGAVQDAIEGEVVDTEMKQIEAGPEPEDF